MTTKHFLLAILFFCAFLSCREIDIETPEQEIDLSSGSIPISIIEQEKVLNNVSKDVVIPSQNLCVAQSPAYVLTEYIPGKGMIECHIQVLPLYAFGNEGVAGDYYAVTGYAVAHNADCYKEYKITSFPGKPMDTDFYGWYMKDLGLHFELLTEEGEPVSADKVSFFVNPEPSTTIGSTVYKKGFDVVLNTSLTVGLCQQEEEGEKSWQILALGNLGLSLNWYDSSSQVLPDQSVEMYTDSQHRNVTYRFKTNNDMGGFATKFIPPLFRTDQRVDFSWVWYVKGGNYSAIDYGFKGMKLKATIDPVYYAKANGKCEDVSGRLVFIESPFSIQFCQCRF